MSRHPPAVQHKALLADVIDAAKRWRTSFTIHGASERQKAEDALALEKAVLALERAKHEQTNPR